MILCFIKEWLSGVVDFRAHMRQELPILLVSGIEKIK